VAKPGFWEYLGFCFFVPTMTVGPINSYGQFVKGFSPPDREKLPLGRSSLRILVGLVKFIVLSHLFEQLSYQGLLFDGYPHHRMDVIVAAVFYYFYLYCNFSGFCDIAIGLAGLLGFPVEENFRDPMAARNLQEFWNRWHITLSRYMRDVVFTPLSKWLIGTLGLAYANAAVALSVFVVFVLVGVWHGAGWNYVAFGAANGFGLVIVFYYGIALKKWLGKERYKWYMQSRLIQGLAIIVTFTYVTGCLFLFANDLAAMRKIWSVLV
jgi:D-alanyl-lipoteichoic acid acyltransferase DltB (MBOAT superfamily)